MRKVHLVALFSMLTAIGRATDYKIPADFATLAAAVASSSVVAGDNLILQTGKGPFDAKSVVVNKGVTIKSQSASAPETIKNTGGGWVDGSGAGDGAALKLNTSGITLQDVLVDNAGVPNYVGVTVNKANAVVTLQNVQITGGMAGLRVEATARNASVTVKDSLVQGQNWIGVHIGGPSSTATFDHSTVQNVAGAIGRGVNVDYGVTGVTVHLMNNSKITRCGQRCLFAHNQPNTFIIEDSELSYSGLEELNTKTDGVYSIPDGHLVSMDDFGGWENFIFTAKRSKFLNAGGEAILIRRTATVDIQDCTIDTTGLTDTGAKDDSGTLLDTPMGRFSGLVLESSAVDSQVSVANTVFRNCGGRGPGCGIDHEGGGAVNFTLTNVAFENCAEAGIYDSEPNSIYVWSIDGMSAKNCGVAGIELGEGANVAMTLKNATLGDSPCGIKSVAASISTFDIDKTTFMNCTSAGMLIQNNNSNTFVITNDTFFNCATGIKMPAGDANASNSVEATYCVFANWDEAAGGYGFDFSADSTLNGTIAESNNIYADATDSGLSKARHNVAIGANTVDSATPYQSDNQASVFASLSPASTYYLFINNQGPAFNIDKANKNAGAKPAAALQTDGPPPNAARLWSLY